MKSRIKSHIYVYLEFECPTFAKNPCNPSAHANDASICSSDYLTNSLNRPSIRANFSDLPPMNTQTNSLNLPSNQSIVNHFSTSLNLPLNPSVICDLQSMNTPTDSLNLPSNQSIVNPNSDLPSINTPTKSLIPPYHHEENEIFDNNLSNLLLDQEDDYIDEPYGYSTNQRDLLTNLSDSINRVHIPDPINAAPSSLAIFETRQRPDSSQSNLGSDINDLDPLENFAFLIGPPKQDPNFLPVPSPVDHSYDLVNEQPSQEVLDLVGATLFKAVSLVGGKGSLSRSLFLKL